MSKSKLHKQLILCSCHSDEHQVIFSYWDDGWEPEIEFTVHLCKKSLLERIKRGVSYIFGHQSRYGDWDEILLKKEQAIEIRDAINSFIKIYDEWEKKQSMEEK